METDSIIAPEAHAFNPATWLKTFESLGGGYAFAGEKAYFGFAVQGRSDHDQQAARQMIESLAGDEYVVLADHLRKQEMDRLATRLGPDLAIRDIESLEAQQ